MCSALCEAVDYRTNLFGRARPSGVEEREEDLSNTRPLPQCSRNDRRGADSTSRGGRRIGGSPTTKLLRGAPQHRIHSSRGHTQAGSHILRWPPLYRSCETLPGSTPIRNPEKYSSMRSPKTRWRRGGHSPTPRRRERTRPASRMRLYAPHLQPIVEQWRRQRAQKKRRLEWYSVSGGPAQHPRACRAPSPRGAVPNPLSELVRGLARRRHHALASNTGRHSHRATVTRTRWFQNNGAVLYPLLVLGHRSVRQTLSRR